MEHVNELIDRIVDFVKEIGITVSFAPVPKEKEFVPGICIYNGSLIIDKNTLKYPGDILHEAAHIAVATKEDREIMDGILETNTDKSAGEEMMAIAWSYAAAIHLKIDPHIVFHEHGYNGGGANIVANFLEGHYIGLPLLQWLGLTIDTKNAAAKELNPYPAMIRWLR